MEAYVRSVGEGQEWGGILYGASHFIWAGRIGHTF